MPKDNDVVNDIISKAEQIATNKMHEFITLEHILLVLLQEPEGANIVSKCGGNVEKLVLELLSFFEETFDEEDFSEKYRPQLTIATQRIFQRALLHSEFSSASGVGIGDILASLFGETDSFAVYILLNQGIERLDILEFLSHGAFEDSFEFSENDGPSSSKNPLKEYTTELTEEASEGSILPLIGRDKEIERISHILARKTKNNAILVGNQGVGKTALIEGLALKIVNEEVPNHLKDFKIYALHLSKLMAGTRYRGDFEARLNSLISALMNQDNSILFIDEIHTIVGAGATGNGTMDTANLLKPVLEKGKLKIIGSTTYDEYQSHFEKDRALARRFSKVEIKEPSKDDAYQILIGLKSFFEKHHNVSYSNAAIRSIIDLSDRYLSDRFLPDKAVDILDEAGAMIRLKNLTAEEVSEDKLTVTKADIETIVSKVANIPKTTVSSDEKDKLKLLEPKLKSSIFGQTEAVSNLCKAVRRSRAGLRNPEKPIGSFLLVGPTGVGKTEITRQLASILGMELVRFDMSEYMEKHSVARLIGAPPGYVGFEQGGLLTDAIIRNPHSVLLLDEIEKAHPDLFNILLQVMDSGKLTDHNGRIVDFRNVMIAMTSNVGSEGVYGSPLGFGNEDRKIGKGAVEKKFRPEFRNRLDSIIEFNSLEGEIVIKLVDKFIDEIRTRVSKKNVKIEASKEAKDWIADKGYTKDYGARSLQRFIQEKIEDKLADEILFGSLQSGGKCEILVKDDEIMIKALAEETEIKPKESVEA